MADSRRQITKIAREVAKFTAQMLKSEGVGTAECDFLHVVRKNPGITQAKVCEVLSLDKGAAARMTARLEEKGLLTRQNNPADLRSKLLYATPEADRLKASKASVEAQAYEWLWQGLPPGEQAELTRLLDVVYQRSKAESRAGFPNLRARYQGRREDGHEEE